MIRITYIYISESYDTKIETNTNHTIITYSKF